MNFITWHSMRLYVLVAQSIQHLVEITRGIEHLASDKHLETGLIAQKFRFQEGTRIEVNSSHAFL